MRPIRWLRRGVLLAGLGAAGGALIVTVRHFLETPQPLQSALPGEGHIDRKHGGDIYYNLAGDSSADPVVLLHDFYPGASNYEYRRIFPRLSPNWHVYAPDWLGFGMSEHPPLAYTGEFYANTLIGFLRDVVGRPAVVLAHGRAANIAARAAADAPDLFTQLVLISPDVEAGIDLEPKPAQLLARAAQRTSLGLVPYAFLSTKPLLRRLVRTRSAQTGEESAGEDIVEHLYASAHQFGGQHALMALMTGELDLPIQNIFPLLQPPVLLVCGDEDPAHPVDAMEDLAVLNPYVDLDVLAGAGEAVFEDQPEMFSEAVVDWLATTPPRQYPQVEESHPVPAAGEEEELAAELAAEEEELAAELAEALTAELAAEEQLATEPEEAAPSTMPEMPETREMPGSARSGELPETPGGEMPPTETPAPSDEAQRTPGPPAAQKATRKPTSSAAKRATRRSVSAPTEPAGEASASNVERPRRSTRQARQGQSPRQQSDTSGASSKKPGSRTPRAKRTPDATQESKNGTPKRSKRPDSPSV